MPQDSSRPSSPNSEPDPPNSNVDEFEQAFTDLEQSLQVLKERYQQVQRDRILRDELQQRREYIHRELRQTNNRQALRAELKHIQEQLETIELNLESRLFWGSLKEPFWQAVRFGGLGIVLGWILKSCAG